MKLVAVEPGWRVRMKGNGSSWKLETISVNEAVRNRPPPLARTFSWKNPGKRSGLTKRIRVEEDCPPVGGVTGFTVKLDVTPKGRPNSESFTDALNPCSDFITIPTVPEPPLATFTELEAREREKSGGRD